MRTIAVVLAGGIGVRTGLGIPKQLIKIAGKSIVEHTLDVLQSHPGIDEILIMMNAGSIHELDHLLDDPSFSKLSRILPGGETRNATTQLALAAIPEVECKVLFHDAVRPFVDNRIITECIEALDTYDAVDTAIPSADTIIQVNDSGCISDIPDRSLLRRGQTPQAFKIGTIRDAYRLANDDPSFKATDDCGVVFSYLPGKEIFVVSGTPENMKVTDPIDIHIADKIFQLQATGLDTSDKSLPDLTGHSIVVFGASYGIGKSIVDLATEAGAQVFAFSRSETNTDITNTQDIQNALRLAAEASGKIDHVVITAGVLTISPLADANHDDVANTIDTNLLAPAIVARESFDYLAASHGSLTLFTSSSYTRGRAGYSLYSATKAGVVNLTQALAEEWADAGVRVNSINPQRTDTPMRTAAFGEEPAGTLLSAEHVATVTTQVLATQLTGQVISVRM